MIKFVDIETGKVFDGSVPYVFFFDGGQSTRLVYSKRICFIGESSAEIYMDSEVFSLIDLSRASDPEMINGFEYYDLSELKVKSITSTAEEVDGYNIHSFYIIANSEVAGQIIDDFYINGEKFKVGGDFYDEEESYLINLANQGQEIPESIQRAIYSTNIHEEFDDNILLNRKWKELLLNSWDTFVCKGSYKSLINSLKWFEYGDLVKISEYWKTNIVGKEVYEETELTSLLSNSYKDALTNYMKTTYIGLHVALERITKGENGEVLYDDGMDKNPRLESVNFKWSLQDMYLKLSLLGNFYETYFMPIHLDLIHSTLEDVVYTCAIKDLEGAEKLREDYVYHLDTFKCNVHDGDKFTISNVNAQVGPNTLFGHKYDNSWDTYDNVYTIGVDVVATGHPNEGKSLVDEVPMSDAELKTFWAQYTNYPGVIVPFRCTIDQLERDSVVEEIISLKVTKHSDTRETQTRNEIIYRDNKIINSIPVNKRYKTEVNFNLMYRIPGTYNIVVQFRTAGSKMYTKRISFEVVDNGVPSLEVYKMVPREMPALGFDFGADSTSDISLFESCYKDIPSSSLHVQYIPCRGGAQGGGVRLNNLLIIKCKDDQIMNQISSSAILRGYYTVYTKTAERDGSTETNKSYNYYVICVSKTFDFDSKTTIIDRQGTKLYNYITNSLLGSGSKGSIYRNDNIFIPEFHTLQRVCPDSEIGVDNFTLDDFTVSPNDAVVVVPVLDNGTLGKRPLEYTINNHTKWTFENISTGERLEYPCLQNFIVANETYKCLSNGYYTISLTYDIDGIPHTVKLNSAMRVRS